MKSYNGFSGDVRNAAQAWLRAEWGAGRLARPARCCACGQDRGVIDAHAEDYSKPFAAGKTDEYHLCFTCHMMVHCRFRNPMAWQRYCAQIASGGRFAPAMKRDFGTFASEQLCGPAGYARAMKGFVSGPVPTRLVLHEIVLRGDQITHGAEPLDLPKRRGKQSDLFGDAAQRVDRG